MTARPPGRQQRSEEGQHGPRVAQVLEDVGARRRRRGRAPPSRRPACVAGLEVADDDLRAVGACLLGRGGVDLDADDRAAAAAQLRGEVAGRAADVEHARAVGDRGEDEPVRWHRPWAATSAAYGAGAHSPQSVATSERGPPRSRCSQR